MSEIPHLLVHEQGDSVGVVVVEGLEASTDMLVCFSMSPVCFITILPSDTVSYWIPRYSEKEPSLVNSNPFSSSALMNVSTMFLFGA